MVDPEDADKINLQNVNSLTQRHSAMSQDMGS